jgi:NADPH:quinone reductase-like Zn-dependent oxidoreductase
VGVFAVQLAAAKGAEVIATARPDADRWIRRLGAAQTADYTVGDVAAQVRRTHPGGVDAVLDLTRDPARFSENAGLVRDGGAAVSVSFTASPELLASERIAVSNFMMLDKPGLLARITAEATSARITVPIHQTVTLDQVPDALARNTAGGARGKTTVRIRLGRFATAGLSTPVTPTRITKRSAPCPPTPSTRTRPRLPGGSGASGSPRN